MIETTEIKMNDSRQIKYQKYILDAILKRNFPHSYGMISTSKKAIWDLIYNRRNEFIDSEFYVFNHHIHLARQIFLEHEIDIVRQELISNYIGENKPSNIFNSDESYSATNHAFVKGPFKLYHFSVMHHAMFKNGTAHKTFGDRERNLYQFVIDVENNCSDLVKNDPAMRELFANIAVLDDELRKVCDTYLYGESADLPQATPIKVNDIKRLMNTYQSKLAKDKENIENDKLERLLPENWTMKDELLKLMIAKKTEWYRLMEEKKAKSKTEGNIRTPAKPLKKDKES